MGNLVCDTLRSATGAECVILNAGTLRSDTLHNPGPIKMKDMVAILPMMDEICTMMIKGTTLWLLAVAVVLLEKPCVECKEYEWVLEECICCLLEDALVSALFLTCRAYQTTVDSSTFSMVSLPYPDNLSCTSL